MKWLLLIFPHFLSILKSRRWSFLFCESQKRYFLFSNIEKLFRLFSAVTEQWMNLFVKIEPRIPVNVQSINTHTQRTKRTSNFYIFLKFHLIFKICWKVHFIILRMYNLASKDNVFKTYIIAVIVHDIKNAHFFYKYNWKLSN